MKSKLLIAGCLMMSATLFAQTATPKVTKRQENQQKRIAKGVDDGQLNAKEAARLENQEAKIQADKKAAKADGTVTPAERKELKHEENKTSKHIYNQKHDAQKRK
ncbi:MAG: hypothetical protein ACXVPU_14730 [Bacteroidia bacterium]